MNMMIPEWWHHPKPYALMDCIEGMKALPDNCIDSIVTDPPYNLTSMTKRWAKSTKFSQNQSDVGKRFSRGFMGKEWDGTGISFKVELWAECLRVLKPGGHLLSFCGTRTYHRMACAIEDAGFEVRDMIAWVYGQGMPKSYDVSKAIDRSEGLEREVIGVNGTMPIQSGGRRNSEASSEGKFERKEHLLTKPSSPEAQQWDGWGSALKPSLEPICLARKPLDGTIVGNVLKWGTGGINIDDCRVPYEGKEDYNQLVNNYKGGLERSTPGTKESWKLHGGGWKLGEGIDIPDENKGRFPANLIHDGSYEVLDLFPNQVSGGSPARRGAAKFKNCYGEFKGQEDCPDGIGGSTGSAARFFYCVKAPRSEREYRLKGNAPCITCGGLDTGTHIDQKGNKVECRRNNHPTIKPLKLIEYLVKLVTPPGGVALDPFLGSGTFLWACKNLHMTGLGFENDKNNEVLIARWCIERDLFSFASY